MKIDTVNWRVFALLISCFLKAITSIRWTKLTSKINLPYTNMHQFSYCIKLLWQKLRTAQLLLLLLLLLKSNAFSVCLLFVRLLPLLLLLLLKCNAELKTIIFKNEPVIFVHLLHRIWFFTLFLEQLTNQVRTSLANRNRRNRSIMPIETFGSKINRFKAGYFENYRNIKMNFDEMSLC